MKKILLFLSCGLLLGCKDNFDITKLNGTDKLVVYCFPSPGDTTDIDLGRSQPVNGKGDAVMIADASVTYQVNGVALTIRNLGDGHYQAIGQQREGDRITLSVKANGLPGTMAETTIPAHLAIEKFEVDTVNMYDRDYEAFRESERFAVTFTDDAASEDFYAVKLVQKVGHHFRNLRINTHDEPAINGMSDIDYDFGFDDSSYQNVVFFTDKSINGRRYTLHLGMPYSRFSPPHRIELYRISPEYYRFIKSINDVSNNDMGKIGLAPITPTYSNVRGGLGVLGGCSSGLGPWLAGEED